MAGHSKWKQIKHQKGAADVKRGALFTKLTREIMQAVREGGPNPDANIRLRLAIQKAKDGNMPMDNIERAIHRASGQGADAEKFEEITYEGYGPGGVAVMVEALTPNRNRTAGEIRSTFTRGGGNLGEGGSVSWNFERKGVITLDESEVKRGEEVALLAIDAGADDVDIDPTYVEIVTAPESLERVRQALEQQGVKVASAEIAMQPKSTVDLETDVAVRNLKLMDALESLDDVQKVYANADFPEAALEAYSAA